MSKEDQKYSLQEYEQLAEFQREVKIGDILLSQTNNILYKAARKVLKVRFDHVSVLVDTESIIHISWPKIRLIHPIQLLSQSSQMLIIRPKITPNESSTFIRQLLSALDHNYDVWHFIQGVWRKLFSDFDAQLPVEFEKIQKKQVCTDLVYFALAASSSEFRGILRDKAHLLDFRIIGSFTPDDFDSLSKITPFFSVSEIQTLKLQKIKYKAQIQKVLQDLTVFKNWDIVKKPFEISDAFTFGELLLNVFSLGKLVTESPEKRTKGLLKLLLKRTTIKGSKQQKLIQQSYHIIEVLRLSRSSKTIMNSFQLVYHLISLVLDKYLPEDGSSRTKMIMDISKRFFSSKSKL